MIINHLLVESIVAAKGPTSSSDTGRMLGIIIVIQRRDYFVALSMFKCIHVMSPSYLSDCITMYNEIAVRDTRASTSSYLVSVPHAPLALFENSFAYRGPLRAHVMS